MPNRSAHVEENDYQHLLGSEQVVVCRDEELGLQAVIAIDDTTRGPGFGGVRLRPYPSLRAGIVEAQRLAAAMTLKNAVAGIPYGGAKSVIFANGLGPDRVRIMRRFGEFVLRTGGAYMPGVDMGTTTEDLREIGSTGAVVACNEVDPSRWTADGVLAAITGAVRFRFGSPSLTGRSVLVQGVGHVGARLAAALTERGAEVIVADTDEETARTVAAATGARAVRPDEAISTVCDVYAPCAAARVITPASVEQLRCAIVAGAANDPLSDASMAVRLVEREITYVPDFVGGAGGVIEVHCHRIGMSDDALDQEIQRIDARVHDLLSDAQQHGRTPLESAHRLAAQALRPPASGTAWRPRA